MKSSENLKRLILPIRRLSFALKEDINEVSMYKNMLQNVFETKHNWRTLPHSQRLNVLAYEMGYVSWSSFVKKLEKLGDVFISGLTEMELGYGNWLVERDREAIVWYSTANRKFFHYANRVEQLSAYIESTGNLFRRTSLNNFKCLGLDFGAGFENLIQFSKKNIKKFYDYKNQHFFRGDMDWLYLYDSQIAFCTLSRINFRNAICHNVDFRYSVFSDERNKGDTMGADLSFCDISYAVFDQCYMRQTIFNKVTAKHTLPRQERGKPAVENALAD